MAPSTAFKGPIYTTALWGAATAAATLALVPVLDLVMSRLLWSGFPEAGPLTEHALIAVAFLAAAAAGAASKHLSLGAVPDRTGFPWTVVSGFRIGASTTVDAMMFFASLSLLLIGFEPEDRAFGIPMAVFASPMAIGFLLMTVNDIASAKDGGRWAAAGGLLVGAFLASAAILNICSAFGAWPQLLSTLADASTSFASIAKIPMIIMLVGLAFTGLPLYAVISGSAALLYLAAGSSIELMPSEAYNLLMNDSMPAIPLFTIAGFVLSESGAGARLVAVFREWFGWLPGGEAFAAVLVCAFFTTFTGANGVAILALGGILATVLIGSGSYGESFAHGFLTASSSVGLLFPPSMAVIVYAVNATFVVQGAASFSIGDMFLGGLMPGALLVFAMGSMAVARSLSKGAASGTTRRRFSGKAAVIASWKALPEIVIPLLILAMYLSGFAGLTEIGAIILLYVIIVEGPVRRDLGAARMGGAIAKALPVAGGALIIIAAARGLSFYTMEAGLPDIFSAWMTNAVSSKFMFLLFLNIALLLVGCFMDIFSAVLVISPLVIPLGAAYGVHPVHLGVIFIMNLSIGFLTPPIGMNLFLASYAFGKPVMKIYKDVLPFFLVQLVVLMAITWIPWFSLALVSR
ncbi:MAG: TRAP transporter permease DctM/Q [Spirochaetae bacterium HGW-Spirochaetae-7]|jgi:tripartite ATP-independent transporter DctM subunit|nr:MAG: TRAP transporter permease DctM/Q [Spirochaetae bacterium HGW-Spirochaetae-7]